MHAHTVTGIQYAAHIVIMPASLFSKYGRYMDWEGMSGRPTNLI